MLSIIGGSPRSQAAENPGYAYLSERSGSLLRALSGLPTLACMAPCSQTKSRAAPTPARGRRFAVVHNDLSLWVQMSALWRDLHDDGTGMSRLYITSRDV
jgi:hypothetical protein